MAQVFNWIRPGYELVTVKLQWNVQVPFLKTTGGNSEKLHSPELFSPKSTPKSKWRLGVYDRDTQISIYVFHYNAAGTLVNLVEPALGKTSILDRNGRKVFQQMVQSSPGKAGMEFRVSKENLMKSECKQADESYSICWKIFTHVKQNITELGNHSDISSDAISCLDELSNHFGDLFDGMPFSDVNFNIGGCDFPAHKSILSARSEVFASMFQHPTKENLTNQIEIEDIEPDVFQELLRFIYTGRVSTVKMKTMAAGLFIAADKYLLDQLKMTCLNHLLHRMSPENCVVLLLTGDLQKPTEPLKEAAKFFRRLPSQVMATERWAKMEEENPRLLCQIHKLLLITN